MLDCTNLLVERVDAPAAIIFPYLDPINGGNTILSKSYLDFFTESPIPDC